MLTFNDRGWLRWMNKKCNFGFGADAETSSDYAKALKACLQASETFETSDEAKSFIEFNSEANFRNTWATMINSGRKPATPEFLNS